MKNMKVWLLLSVFVSCGFQNNDWQPEERRTYTFGEFAGYYKTEAEARSETRESHLVDYRYHVAFNGFGDTNIRLELYIIKSDRSEDNIQGNCLSEIDVSTKLRGVGMEPNTLYKLEVSKYGKGNCDPPLLDRQYFYFKTIEEIS